MISNNNNFFNKINIFLDKQSIEIIQQSLEYYDEWIFKNKNIDKTLKEFKDYKVKETKPRTLTILNGKITFKRRKYYKIKPETGKEEYIFPLDKLLGIEKWQRIDNTVKEKILSFITEKKI